MHRIIGVICLLPLLAVFGSVPVHGCSPSSIGMGIMALLFAVIGLKLLLPAGDHEMIDEVLLEQQPGINLIHSLGRAWRAFKQAEPPDQAPALPAQHSRASRPALSGPSDSDDPPRPLGTGQNPAIPS